MDKDSEKLLVSEAVKIEILFDSIYELSAEINDTLFMIGSDFENAISKQIREGFTPDANAIALIIENACKATEWMSKDLEEIKNKFEEIKKRRDFFSKLMK